jgi:hypothetical protein
MPLVIKWSFPLPLTRAGGCEAGNVDLIPGPVNGATTCLVELDPTPPATGVSVSQQPTVTATPVGTTDPAINITYAASTLTGTAQLLTFTIGNKGERAGVLYRLEIQAFPPTVPPEAKARGRRPTAATPNTLTLYYVFQAGLGTTGTPTATGAAAPVRTRARVPYAAGTRGRRSES